MIGQTTQTSDQAVTAIENAGTGIDAGDALLAGFKYENAVQTYQTAGAQFVGIKPLMNPSSSLDQADGVNTQLQALVWHLASRQTADQSQSLAKQIQSLYVNAYNATGAIPLTGQIPPAAPGPTGPAASGGISPWIIVGGLALLGVGGILLLLNQGPKKNPLDVVRRPRSSRSNKRLIAKGHNVFFEMNDGREIKTIGSMMHDPSGRAWPRNSILIGSFSKTRRNPLDPWNRPQRRRDERDDDAERYFGASYRRKWGSIELPPKSLSGWKRVGTVERIYYTRGGHSHPGRYQHPFGVERGLFHWFRKGGRATLYRRGRFYRLQLPRDAVVNERGFVSP